jgi:hypothetical protein
MNYATYFPEQRHLLTLTTIRRERLLPEDAIGAIEASAGERVDLRDVVARGTVPSRYMILEAAEFFRLRDPDRLDELLQVEVDEQVEAGQVLAGRLDRRGKRLLSPVDGVVAYIGRGRIIIQETPEDVEIEAGLIGQVIAVREPRGVMIETVGAVLQGVWGNGRMRIGALRPEPEEGLENIYTDQIDISYRGAIVVTRRPLRAFSLQIIEDQGLSGVIAPSMDAGLIDAVKGINAGVLLTEGFGNIRMSQFVYSFLESMTGKPATLDAVLPGQFDLRRPEVIVNVPTRGDVRPPPPNASLALNVGMNVRLTRGNYVGVVGQVTELPAAPQVIENGLRVPCARVQLVTGESMLVPLANIEVFGR